MCIQRVKWLDGIIDSMDMSKLQEIVKGTGKPGMLQSVQGLTKTQTRQ